MPPDTTGGPATQTDTNAGAQSSESQSQQQAEPAAKSIMDFLDIPADVQSKIAPAAEQKPEVSSQQSQAEAPSIDAASQPKTETEEEEEAGTHEAGEEETGTDQEQEHEQEQPEDKGKIDKRQKRINRLTRQKAQLEEQLDAVAAQNQQFREYFGKLQQAQARQQNGVPIGTGRLAHVMDEQQLGQEVATAQGVIEWCDANPDGVTTGEGENQKFVEPTEIAKWRREAEKVVLNAPERREQIRAYTQIRGQSDQFAYQNWPELFDRSSKEHQVAAQILGELPALAQDPRAATILGVYLEGLRSFQARQKTNGENGQAANTAARRDISPRAFDHRVPLSPHTANPPSRDVKPSATKKLNEAKAGLVADPDGSASSLARVFQAMDEVNPRTARRLVRT